MATVIINSGYNHNMIIYNGYFLIILSRDLIRIAIHYPNNRLNSLDRIKQ
jgi:hypothetical protein